MKTYTGPLLRGLLLLLLICLVAVAPTQEAWGQSTSAIEHMRFETRLGRANELELARAIRGGDRSGAGKTERELVDALRVIKRDCATCVIVVVKPPPKIGTPPVVSGPIGVPFEPAPSDPSDTCPKDKPFYDTRTKTCKTLAELLAQTSGQK